MTIPQTNSESTTADLAFSSKKYQEYNFSKSDMDFILKKEAPQAMLGSLATGMQRAMRLIYVAHKSIREREKKAIESMVQVHLSKISTR